MTAVKNAAGMLNLIPIPAPGLRQTKRAPLKSDVNKKKKCGDNRGSITTKRAPRGPVSAYFEWLKKDPHGHRSSARRQSAGQQQAWRCSG
jgi:hypothetical protein